MSELDPRPLQPTLIDTFVFNRQMLEAALSEWSAARANEHGQAQADSDLAAVRAFFSDETVLLRHKLCLRHSRDHAESPTP